jgi:hypothetical protein
MSLAGIRIEIMTNASMQPDFGISGKTAVVTGGVGFCAPLM